MVSAVVNDSTVAPLLEVTLAGTPTDHELETQCAEAGDHPARRGPLSKTLARFEQECEIVRATGYGPAITELIRLGLDLRRRGHGMFVEGSAASSTLLYLVGLTHLNPAEHGLFTERFIDTGADRAWPAHERRCLVPHFFKVQISMGQADFLTLLRERGYSFSVEHDTIPGYPARTISAGMRGTAAGSPTVQMAVETSALAILSNCAGEPWDDTPTDVQTWQLLATGDTDGIEPLESAFAQDLLRARKPRSLAAVADVLVLSRPGSLGEWARMPQGAPAYQEDLMQLVHDRLGIGLRDAYDLVSVLAERYSERLVETREWFFKIEPPEPLSPREWNSLWEKLVRECPFAVCKAHFLVTAHHCLRAAHLKAHHPADFRAVLAATHPRVSGSSRR